MKNLWKAAMGISMFGLWVVIVGVGAGHLAVLPAVAGVLCCGLVAIAAAHEMNKP